MLLAAGALFVVPLLRGGPSLSATLKPFTANLAKDQYPAYQRAAEALEAAAGPAATPALRSAAAELLLVAALARGGEKSKISRAEELVTALASVSEPPPTLARARALAAVSRGRGGEVDNLLGASATAGEGLLVVALRRLRENKPELAVAPLRAYTASAPDKLVGTYLLGRAFETSGKRAEAEAAYKRVVAANPQHAGARVALLRLARRRPRSSSRRPRSCCKRLGRAPRRATTPRCRCCSGARP